MERSLFLSTYGSDNSFPDILLYLLLQYKHLVAKYGKMQALVCQTGQ